MSKHTIYKSERYPDFSIDVEVEGGVEVEIPDETAKWIKTVDEEYQKVQNFLEILYNAVK